MIWKIFCVLIILFTAFTCWAVCHVGSKYPKGGSSERESNK